MDNYGEDEVYIALNYREKEAYGAMVALLETLRETKPNDRSDADRIWAVTITEVEKALGYFAWHMKASQ